MAGAFADWDGFVSTRGDSLRFGIRLHDELIQPPHRIRLAHQETCKKLSANDHTIAAAQLIESASFVVVLLGPSRFRPSMEDRGCFQVQELRRIIARANDAENSKVDTFRVFFVLLQDRDSQPDKDTFDELLKQDGDVDDALWRSLTKHKSYHFIRNYTDPTTREWQDDVSALVGQIRSFVDETRALERKRAARVADVGPAPAAERPAAVEERIVAADAVIKPEQDKKASHLPFEDIERAYVRRSIESWSMGLVGTVSIRGGDSAFKFRPGRFVEFSANQYSRDGTHEDTIRTMPLSHWLFRTQDLPLLLVGEGGAGKTTALTAAACAFAAARDDTCSRLAKEIGSGEWFETAMSQLEGNGVSNYVPVVMRCVDAAGAMGAKASSQTLLAAMLGHMRSVAEEESFDGTVSKADRDAFLARLGQQPYVLMLDGLDEIANDETEEALYTAAHHLASGLSEAGFRIIFTTRDSHWQQRPATRVVLDKPLDSGEHIETFIHRFAKDAKAERRLLQAANAIRSRGDTRNFPLRTPLLLNAFCCIALEDDYDPGERLSEFCRRTIDYLLKGRRLPLLAEAQADQSEKPEDVARRILSRYALAFITFSDKGRIRQGEDETAAWLRREGPALGLVKQDVSAAKDLLRELAAQTNLFRLEANGTYTFDNTAMFWEYLAAEEMAAQGIALQLTDTRRLKLHSWRAAIRFAHAINVEKALDGHELDVPLALLDVARAAADKDVAWSVAELALQLLAESPPPDMLDGALAPSLLKAADRAAEVFFTFKAHWNAAVRATFCDLFYQAGRREDGEKTLTAVDRLMDILMRPRRRWVEVAAEGLQTGLQVSEAPVLVAEFRCFAEDPEARTADWWPDCAGPMLSDQPNASGDGVALHDGWIRQMDRPGSPVVSITFHEAVAYCQWRTQRMRESGELDAREVIRLPTESEWAALLRWASGGAKYPWGDQSLAQAKERVNWMGADVDHPSAPGVFECIGADGLYDLGSNVSCWTTPSDFEGEWPPAVRRQAAVSGGCWFEFKPDAFRAVAPPDLEAPTHRSAGIGMRVVRAPATT